MSSYKNVLRTAELMKEMNCYKNEYFDDRILIQKKLFLTFRCGICNDFDFSWGQRGVYSADLNLVSHTILKNDPIYLKKHKLSTKEQDVVKYINGLAKEIERNDLDISEVSWYELLADILYLSDQGLEKDHIIETLKQDGIDYSPKVIKHAFKTNKKGKWNKE